MDVKRLVLAIVVVVSSAVGTAQAGNHGPHYSVLKQPPAPVYGFAAPSYHWGWFGSAYRPLRFCHTGYYGAYSQYSYQRGF